MDKETRTFIWGIVLTILCSIGAGVYMIQLKSGMDYAWYDWVLFVGFILGIMSGVSRINETTN